MSGPLRAPFAISKNLQALEEKLRQLNISYEIANYEYWDRASRIGTAGVHVLSCSGSFHKIVQLLRKIFLIQQVNVVGNEYRPQMSVEECAKTLEIMFSLADRVGRLQITGGEPLLHR